MKIIVGKTAGFCYGVKRAVDGCIEQIEKNENKKIYCLGELVHNKKVVESLKNKGIEFVEDINQIKGEKSKVIIRAHGVEKNTYKKADDMGIEVIDYTCPNVLKIHKIVQEYKQQGYYIFLIGTENHPEVIGITSYCGQEYTLITNEEDIEGAIQNLQKSNIKKLLVISQTTYSTKKFDIIKNIIQEKVINNIEIVIKNTICLATETRQKETKELSSKVDAMVIIGGKNSSNTKKIYDVALENCKNTVCIETNQEIDKQRYEGIDSIGIMAGASTPQNSIDEVIKALSE